MIARAEAEGLSRWGRAGLALFALHLILLFFPPLPPDVKGSLWSYVAGYGSVALLLVEVGRSWRWRLLAGWGRRSPGGRWAVGLGAVVAVLIVALAVRSASPVLFARFSREEGLWEPVTLFLYLASSLVLAGASRHLGSLPRRHWRFVAVVYGVMGLEEVDYFGVFGGMIGRIEGVYVGSLHDLILLAAKGLLSPLAWILIGLAGLGLAAALWRWRYLQPRALAGMVASVSFLWLVTGLGFLFVGAAGEAELLAWAQAQPTPEEAIELCGAICFGLYALQAGVELTAEPDDRGLER